MTFQLAGNAPQIYQDVLVPAWFDRWAKAMIDLVPLEPGQRVLDVACGTGVVARRARPKVGPGGQVEGLDINTSMLAMARDLSADFDIAWIESDVSQIPRPNQHYDLVLCQHGYHYFPDKAAALGEIARVLRPGGRLAVSIWDGHNDYTNALCDALGRHLSADIAAKQREQRTTPPTSELADELRAGGFSDVEIVRQELLIDVPAVADFVPLHLGSMPIAAAYEALDEAEQKALISEVEAELGHLRQGDRLIYPDSIHVFLARI